MKIKKITPAKRHAALVQFSKEHHHGLLLWWKIKEGLKKKVDIKRIAAYLLFSFDKSLHTHFKEEEKILFSKLKDSDNLKKQAMREHANIYALIENIRNGNADAATLSTFANDLKKHIRFEERILFHYIQEKLTDEELQEVLNNHTHAAADIDEQWNDHFWEN
jgi:hemerythrin-like domain-containing protein